MTLHLLRPAAAIAIAAAALAACSSGPDPEELGRLGFMVGCWQSNPDAQGRVNKEVWSTPQGGLMFGWATAIQGGQVVSFEQTRIDLRTQHASYIASPEGQRPVVFTETAAAPATPAAITFENGEHDFPQRIVYRQPKKGELAATISRLDGSRPVNYAWVECGKAAPVIINNPAPSRRRNE
ncbi:MAG TPA: DUF6265 family protein [Hyphomonadaceae bacterium]|nr:DUF6265 family protein [Hyphomonadaceae bacterium]